jgi:hypothetical protein
VTAANKAYSRKGRPVNRKIKTRAAYFFLQNNTNKSKHIKKRSSGPNE